MDSNTLRALSKQLQNLAQEKRRCADQYQADAAQHDSEAQTLATMANNADRQAQLARQAADTIAKQQQAVDQLRQQMPNNQQSPII